MKYSLVIVLLLTSTMAIAQNSAGSGGTTGAEAGSGSGNSAGAGSRPISGVNNRNGVQGTTSSGVGVTTTGVGTSTSGVGNSTTGNGTGNLNNNTNFNNSNNNSNSIYPQNNGVGGSNQIPAVRNTGRTGVVSDGTTTTNLGTGVPQNNGPLVNNPGSDIAGSVTDMPTSVRRVRNTTTANCITSNGRTLSSRDSGYAACVNSSRKR